MHRRELVIVLFCLGAMLNGCATPLQKGVTAYNSGAYDAAAKNWNAAALAGEPNAQYNLGLLWSQGLGSTRRDAGEAMAWFLKAAQQGHVTAMVALAKHQLDANQPEPALSWLNLAARWADPTAISMLSAMSAPVPQADLYAAHQVARQQALLAQQQGQVQLGYALGCALAGGCSTSAPQSPPASSPAYQQRRSPIIFSQPPSLYPKPMPVGPTKAPNCKLSTLHKDVNGNPLVECSNQ